jgi:pSer/pThr/pTyr-binding forkhead associated (FHA) protein
LILPLRKGEGRPFPERISVGRAINCDLVIRDASVSKLHGHFRDVSQDIALFTDAKSSNGTRLDGALIKPGAATEIRANTLLSFGRVQLVFMSPGDVYDWL